MLLFRAGTSPGVVSQPGGLTPMNAMTEQPILPFAKGDWRVEPRGSVGTVLAEARRRCAMTIEQVAETTRVPIRYLAAIEAERFDVIPGVIYLKGFVKAFARAVGLCERWAMDAINAALSERRRATA
ncbi:hypothetical protein FPZ54_04340 [Sphingomonas suaedae]|uniref:Helix-turn-helix domain-containing protein n=1 Tax=Sphingomonas suaedae TaxID=2599297 RepID=A0A518RD82_9SPHN|nr:hypothetical protein FPZ54_04340 [Sphingomonas suaedae]